MELPALFQVKIISQYIENTLTKFKNLLRQNHWANFMQPNLAQSIPGRGRLNFLKVKDHLILQKDSLIQPHCIVIALRKCVY